MFYLHFHEFSLCDFKFAGYSAYAPTKAALISLANCLRHELIGGNGRGIQVHVFLPASINTPGFVEEQRIKPQLTQEIEKDDVAVDPDQCAASLFLGLDKNYFQITSDLKSDLLRCASKTHAPSNNGILDYIMYTIAWVREISCLITVLILQHFRLQFSSSVI
jgi:3-dehydrosphinganine reductase